MTFSSTSPSLINSLVDLNPTPPSPTHSTSQSTIEGIQGLVILLFQSWNQHPNLNHSYPYDSHMVYIQSFIGTQHQQHAKQAFAWRELLDE
jgi:hypothetical protein